MHLINDVDHVNEKEILTKLTLFANIPQLIMGDENYQH